MLRFLTPADQPKLPPALQAVWSGEGGPSRAQPEHETTEHDPSAESCRLGHLQQVPYRGRARAWRQEPRPALLAAHASDPCHRCRRSTSTGWNPIERTDRPIMRSLSRGRRRGRSTAVVITAATALIASTFTASASQTAIPKPPKDSAQRQASTPAEKPASSAIPLKDRDTVLGKGWKASADRAVITAADSDGLHLLVADSTTGYAWKNVTVLSEPQLPADTWIGNSCVMDDHHAAVAYAPRAFTNKPDLMMGGAFTAIVNLDDGSVTKLPFTASLAYFDPTCSPTTHTAVFTALRDTKTHLVTVNTKGTTVAGTTAKGEITSAVPTKDGVIAAAGNRLVHVDRKGSTTKLAATKHAPYGIHVTRDGTVSYIDRTGDTDANVQMYAHGRKSTVASGKLTAMNLRQGTDGTVYLTGKAGHGKGLAASGIKALGVSPDADVSTRGRLAVDPVLSPAVQAGIDNIKGAGRGFTGTATKEPAAETTTGHTSHALTITSTVPGTGKRTQQKVAEAGSTAGSRPSPVLTGSSKPQMSTTSVHTTAADARANDPIDTDAWCAVPRNDVGTQALQPTPNQVEWAVDMAVQGNLRSGYLTQGGWRSQTGISTIDPQGLFPKPKLTGGGRIPAQVQLGILAQESNLWQAESGAIPGQMGNPLAAVDGFYGHQTGGSLSDFWTIRWDKSDCGYGVGQVTDGMRKAGHEKPKETSLPVSTQRAVAIDYATNIAASLYILADKWNEVHESGQTIAANNDDSAKPENWFTAVWNYNLGFNKKADAGTNGNWGLGWYNNPANPVYPASRLAFMNTDLDPLAAKDAAHPQNWPYEEKVMGWAAWSIDTGHSYATSGRQDWPGESGFSSAGFYPAYWNGTNGTVIDKASAKYHRAHVTPPLDAFCNTKNKCNTASPPNCPDAACYAQYWYHESNTTWKSDCATSCGFEHIKYQTLINEPGRGTRLQYGTPVCSGAPSGAKVVESVPAGTDTWSDCGTTATDGSFQFTFYPDPNATGPGLGQYDAKADLHQIGGGYDGHFWYTHTRDVSHLGGDGGRMSVKGDWKLGSAVKGGGAKIYAHIPDTGAQTSRAVYHVVTPFGTVDKAIDQKANAGKWVSLGGYNFNDQAPEVTLTNTTSDGTGDDDIAWGAVAVQPGDFSGFPHINFKAENPNSPDIDNIAAQTPQDVAAPTPDAALSIQEKSTSSTRSAESEQNCSEPNKAGLRICTGPFHGSADKTAKSAVGASTLAVAGSGPVDWCDSLSTPVSKSTRTEGCIKGTYAVNVTNDSDVVVGGGTVRVTQQIKLDPRSQTFTVWSNFALPDLQGEATSMTLDNYVNTCWATSECTKDTLGAWSGSTTFTKGDTHSVSRTETFSWNKVAGGQGTLSFTWDTSWTSPGMKGSANNSWRDKAFNIRCDNQVAGNTGCVFPDTTPTLVLNTEKYPAAAAYYYAMQEKLASHPGSEKYKKPLHREANDTTAKNNRNIICKLAVAEWKPNSNAIGSSCDEYPFAKSKESGGTQVNSGKECVQMYATDNGDGTYTVKLDENYAYPTWNEVCGRLAVTTSQNTAAGGDLGRFTQDVRLLDDDAYFVRTGYESCDVNTVCNF
ncbi:Tat pathway signal protein [Streptomyces mirabilis]|uniref:golvesin C-terminal-like domain-containing protein n=1 Tax=Streptomyces mirabilis TaxID=68239 RepID=UPI0036668F7C